MSAAREHNFSFAREFTIARIYKGRGICRVLVNKSPT